MTGSRRRVRRSLFLASVLSVVLATAAWAATWYSTTDTAHTVGGNYSWNYGSSLGQTDSGALHVAYVTDKIPGKGWVTDTGPYEGVYYTKSADDGTTWTKPKRLNKATQHADRSALWAVGDCVYVTWVSQKFYTAYDPADPRVLWFRSNCTDGDPLSWSTAIKLSSGTGRVDYPVVAAEGTNVYAIYTNSNSGKVTLKRSTDNGATWTIATLDTSTRDDFDDPLEGKGAWPGICAGGSGVVGTVWMDNNAGRMVARVSTDSGATFGSEFVVESGNAGINHGWGQCDVKSDGDIAFGWTNATAARVAVYSGGSLGSAVTVATFSSGGTYKGGYGIAPAWSAGGKLGVAWGDCRTTGCDYFANSDRVDLTWSESTDGGATWSARELLASSSATTKRINDYPSILWLDESTRFVHYNGWNANYTNYRLYYQVGTG